MCNFNSTRLVGYVSAKISFVSQTLSVRQILRFDLPNHVHLNTMSPKFDDFLLVNLCAGLFLAKKLQLVSSLVERNVSRSSIITVAADENLTVSCSFFHFMSFIQNIL